MNLNDELAEVFKALSNPQRLAIYQTICSRTFCCFTDSRSTEDGSGRYNCNVGVISSSFELAPATVSHHIKELKNAGLIKMERKGKFIYLTPLSRRLKEISGFMKSLSLIEKEAEIAG